MMRGMRSLPRSIELGAAALIRAWSAPPGLVGRERDVVFDGEHGLAMDIYRPRPDDAPSPAVVLLHGGAFVRGDKRSTERIGETLARVGYVAFSVNYRLIPEGLTVTEGVDRYWEAVSDVEAAVSFIWARADRFAIDVRRVGAFGISAGGTFAAMLGWRGVKGRRDRMPIRAVVSWSGALDMYEATRDPSLATRAGAPAIPGREDGTLELHREALIAASPFTYLDDRSAPTLLVNAREDFVPLDTARTAARRLEEAGVPAELLVRRRGHALAYAGRTILPSLRFLDQHVRDRAQHEAPSPAPPGAVERGSIGELG